MPTAESPSPISKRHFERSLPTASKSPSTFALRIFLANFAASKLSTFFVRSEHLA
jgi:hypothetical protein